MQFRNKRIAIWSPQPWNDLFVSKHHVALALAARGAHVFFIGPPRSGTSAISSVKDRGVHVVSYPHWFKGINRLPTWIQNWYYRSLIDRIADHAGGVFHVHWCFDTSRMQSFPKGPEFKLLQIADLDVLTMGHGLLASADLVLATSKVITDELFNRFGVKAVNVGHSLSMEWFHGMDERAKPRTNKPRNVVYAGNLSRSFNDWKGFAEVVEEHPELNFRFIGTIHSVPEAAGLSIVQTAPNAEFHAPLQMGDLITALCEADMLLFGFLSERFAREMSNPHKVLEYLATGNVVVGSYILEYKDNPTVFCMARMDEPLISIFNRALAQFPILNSVKARSARIEFARKRSMVAMLQRVEGLMPSDG